ncbi:hypothetical protein KIN20_003745 [Parelaphostrongylus tenuis]|uniref:EH domain-containing protein n=1 Tax=Parelaphostrongylus tenuis TaxID=148309 RepID=A0AAD5QHK9_PARTN|nr:hypothetical protein KIN20_003745 [Parelaphostrongylus tenuis]
MNSEESFGPIAKAVFDRQINDSATFLCAWIVELGLFRSSPPGTCGTWRRLCYVMISRIDSWAMIYSRFGSRWKGEGPIPVNPRGLGNGTIMSRGNPSTIGYGQQNKIMEEVMMTGNIPIPAPGRVGMMGGGGGVVPPALLDESRVPRFYRDAIAACGATQHSMLPHTALVYNLMVTSGLPRSVLSYIWSAVNRTLPGQLTRPEFFSCLALIALAQKGESLVALSTMSSLPIPFLQPIQVPAEQPLPAPVVNVAKPATSVTPKQQRQTSSFIPTSLLPSRRSNVKKEVDLLGEPIPPCSAAKDEESTAQIKSVDSSLNDQQPSAGVYSSALNDLYGIDLSDIASTQSTVSHSLNSSTKQLKNGEDGMVSTASEFSMCCSTASEINGSVDMSPIISQELLECWEKIIVAAADIFKDADKLLGSTTDSVLKEVAQTERGDGYLRCLNRLYFVVCRVERSAGIDLPKKCLDEIMTCRSIWKRLSSFMEGSEEEEDTCNGGSGKHCAICCQPVSNAVYFGGQTYHSECANLWVNDVNSLLPNMHLDS